MAGRVALDLRLLLEREEKLRTYSFEEACEFYFHHPKERLDFATRTDLFDDPHPAMQHRLVEYAVRQAELTKWYAPRPTAWARMSHRRRLTWNRDAAVQ